MLACGTIQAYSSALVGVLESIQCSGWRPRQLAIRVIKDQSNRRLVGGAADQSQDQSQDCLIMLACGTIQAYSSALVGSALGKPLLANRRLVGGDADQSQPTGAFWRDCLIMLACGTIQASRKYSVLWLASSPTGNKGCQPKPD